MEGSGPVHDWIRAVGQSLLFNRMDEREMAVKRISVHNTRLGGIGGASKRDSGQGTVWGGRFPPGGTLGRA